VIGTGGSDQLILREIAEQPGDDELVFTTSLASVDDADLDALWPIVPVGQEAGLGTDLASAPWADGVGLHSGSLLADLGLVSSENILL